MAALALLPALIALLGAMVAASPTASAATSSAISASATSRVGASRAAVSTLCLPAADKSGCIAGTIGTRADPIAGVDVILTDPEGKKTSVTTGADGKFSFQITAAGEYLVALDPSTIPKGTKVVSPQAKDLGPNGELKVEAVLGQTRAVILQVRADDFSTSSSKLDETLQGAASGLRLGLLLALASVGLSLIYGTTGLANFAHAEQVTLGGMLGYFFSNKLGIPLVPGIIIVTLVCASTGFVQDRFIWRPLRRRGLALNQLIIVTIGLSLALQYVFQVLVGAGSVRVLTANPAVSTFGPVKLTHQSLAGMAVAVIALAAVGYALLRTRVGRATRAVSDNPGLASASGIDPDRVISLVWTVGAGLAGLGGIFYALVNNGVKWDSGLQILLLLFAAVTLGGLGTAFGALIGSLVIGLVVELSPVFGMPGDFKYATPLVILILLLLVRPQGLLGRAQRVG